MKRNTLTTAVLAGLTGMAGMVSVSNAVNVNPDGLGQVLLYPYYTARGDNDTLVSIVNTTDRGKAVKIRFIEALNSREVLDFNIYMSPFDVWVGGITETDDGGAKLIVPDATCTVPYIYEFAGSEQEFLDFEYTGDNVDGGPEGIERTASGYIEVIEMGTMVETPEDAPAESDPSYIPYAAKHLGGTPNDCQHFVDQWTRNLGGVAGSDLEWISGDVTHGFDDTQMFTGGLFGGASIINVNEGTMYAYNANAIDGFWAAGDPAHFEPGDLQPDLASSSNTVSNVFANGAVVRHDWANGTAAEPVAALNAVLTYDMVMNEYVTDSGLFANTEWVLTFPTKRFHTDAAGGFVAEDDPVAPFQRTWNGADEFSCEDFSFTTPTSFEDYYQTGGSRAFDREERPDVDPPEGPDPIPPIVSPRPPAGDDEPPPPDVFQLCREANIIRFSSDGETPPDNSEVFGESWRDGNGLGYSNFGLQFENGWVRLDLAEIGVSGSRRQSTVGENLDSGAFERVEGLPVVGFSANSYVNEALEGGAVRANYAGSFNHRGTRSIVASD